MECANKNKQLHLHVHVACCMVRGQSMRSYTCTASFPDSTPHTKGTINNRGVESGNGVWEWSLGVESGNEANDITQQPHSQCMHSVHVHMTSCTMHLYANTKQGMGETNKPTQGNTHYQETSYAHSLPTPARLARLTSSPPGIPPLSCAWLAVSAAAR